jgi:hypothetical protein
MLYNKDTNVICLIDISLNIFDGFFKGKTFDPTFKTTIIKLYIFFFKEHRDSVI